MDIRDRVTILQSKALVKYSKKNSAAADQVLVQEKYNTAARKAMAEKGHALPDGSYPIGDVEDLHNAAILAKSGHGNVAAAKRLIGRRASEMGAKNPLDDTVMQMMRIDGTLPFKMKDGSVAYIPYGTVVQDETGMGVGVPSTDLRDGSGQPMVGKKNPQVVSARKKKMVAESPGDQDAVIEAPPGKKMKKGFGKTIEQDGMICPRCGAQMVKVPNETLGESTDDALGDITDLVAEDKTDTGLDNDVDDDDLGKPMPKGFKSAIAQAIALQGKMVCAQCGYVMQDADDGGVYQSIVLQMDDEKRVITVVVQSPDVPTTPATMPGVELIYPKETIQKTAWDFAEKIRNGAFGVMHTEVVQGKDGKPTIVPPNGEYAVMLENYVLPVDWPVVDSRGQSRLIAQGSWIQTLRIKDDNTWEACKRGELNAISLASTKVKFTDITDQTI